MIKIPEFRSNFTRIHNSVLLCASLSCTALRLYVVLSSLRPTTTIGNKFLMRLTGIKQDKTITKHIRELIAAGLLKTTFAVDANGKPTGFRNFELFIKEENSTKAPSPTVDECTMLNEQTLNKQGLNNIDINLINTNNTHKAAITNQIWALAIADRGILLEENQCLSINKWISYLFNKRGAFAPEQIEANINTIQRIITDGYDIGIIIEDTIAAKFAILIKPMPQHKLKASSMQPSKNALPHQYDNPDYGYPETKEAKDTLVRKIMYWYAKGLNPKKDQRLGDARMNPAEADIIARHLGISNRICGSTSADWQNYILKNEVLTYRSLLDQDPSESLAHGIARPINAELSKYCK